MARIMYCCPHCEELFDDEDDFFEHVTECQDEDMNRLDEHIEPDGYQVENW